MPFFLMSGVGAEVVLVYPRPKGHGRAGTVGGVMMGLSLCYITTEGMHYVRLCTSRLHTHTERVLVLAAGRIMIDFPSLDVL